jgi:hypothetical protein
MIEDCLESRLSVLRLLWNSLGKRVSIKRLMRYQRVCEGVPLVLLERAVKKVIEENDNEMVAVPAVVLCAVRKELGWPEDFNEAIEKWKSNH